MRVILSVFDQFLSSLRENDVSSSFSYSITRRKPRSSTSAASPKAADIDLLNEVWSVMEEEDVRLIPVVTEI